MGVICPTCGSPECAEIDCRHTDDEADDQRQLERDEREAELDREQDRVRSHDREEGIRHG